MRAEIKIRNLIIVVAVFLIAVLVPYAKYRRGEAPVKQGIDLAGGVDLLLQAVPPVGKTEVTDEDLQGAIAVLRNRLDPEGVKEIVLQRMGTDRIVVQIPGEDDPERVRRLIGTTATLRFINAGDTPLEVGTRVRFIDAQTGLPIEDPLSQAQTPEVSEEPLVFSTTEVLYKAEDFVGFVPYTGSSLPPQLSAGEADLPLSTAGGDISLEFVQASGIKLTADSARLKGNYFTLVIDNRVRKSLLVTEAFTHGRIVFPGLANDPEFNMDELNADLSRVVIVNAGAEEPAVGREVVIWDPMSGQPAPEGEQVKKIVDIKSDQVILTGEDFANADVTFGRMGEPIIAFEFKGPAAQIFGRFTAQNVRKYLAISLDDTIISCPVIREPILGGRGVIEGQFQLQEAQDLVIKLNSGRLPVTLNIVENRTVGPILGERSIQESKRAAIAGALLVVIFMLLYYRLPGLLADLALIFYAVVFYGALSVLNATLTLPGIAGFVMSVGMAVDANVIIFERLKEELRAGKTFRSSIETAFKRAWTAIFDSNITTIMAGVVLYNLGTGPIRGFAVTLVIGVAVSMFSALTVTRLLMEWALGNPSTHRYWLFGLKDPSAAVQAKGGEA